MRPCLVVAAGLLLTAASCGGPGETPAPGGLGDKATSAPTGGPIPAGLTDPCSLLTTAEINTMAGSKVNDGVRDAEEDGTFVVCRWYATADDLKIAPVVGVTLFLVNDEMKKNIQSDISSGKGAQLPVGENTEVQAADLGVTGNSYAAGWKGSVFYRLTCQTPVSGGNPAKAICTQAVTAVANRLAK
jgi:hypothetical protein